MTPVERIKRRRLRAWLHYVIDTAIDMLDALDAEGDEREDDELGDDDALPVPAFGGARA